MSGSGVACQLVRYRTSDLGYISAPDMSWLGAKLFTWIQAAPFYEAVHADAVHLLPSGAGRTWLDVGCGPGLVARLASQHGYQALGLDRDPAMITAARQHSVADQCRFEVGTLGFAAEPRYSADVVSAASLLGVLPDPGLGLRQLWHSVRPGGTLLVVETTSDMAPARVRDVAPPGLRHPALALWSYARRGRTIDPAIFEEIRPTTSTHHMLMYGLLQAWVLQKYAA